MFLLLFVFFYFSNIFFVFLFMHFVTSHKYSVLHLFTDFMLFFVIVEFTCSYFFFFFVFF